MSNLTFLKEEACCGATLLVDIVSKTRPTARARIVRSYSSKTLPANILEVNEFDFVFDAAKWGRVEIELDERVLIFVFFDEPSRRVLETPSHFRVVDIHGIAHAIAFYDMRAYEMVPVKIKENTTPYGNAGSYSAVPLEILEQYILSVITECSG